MNFFGRKCVGNERNSTNRRRFFLIEKNKNLKCFAFQNLVVKTIKETVVKPSLSFISHIGQSLNSARGGFISRLCKAEEQPDAHA